MSNGPRWLEQRRRSMCRMVFPLFLYFILDWLARQVVFWEASLKKPSQIQPAYVGFSPGRH